MSEPAAHAPSADGRKAVPESVPKSNESEANHQSIDPDRARQHQYHQRMHPAVAEAIRNGALIDLLAVVVRSSCENNEDYELTAAGTEESLNVPEIDFPSPYVTTTSAPDKHANPDHAKEAGDSKSTPSLQSSVKSTSLDRIPHIPGEFPSMTTSHEPLLTFATVFPDEDQNEELDRATSSLSRHSVHE